MPSEDQLRLAEGGLLAAGGIVAALSLQRATLSTARLAAVGVRDTPLPQAIPTVTVGLALLALGFVAAVAADAVAGERRRAACSAVAALSAVGLAVGPRLVTLVGGATLLLAGIAMLALSVDADALRERFPV